jgi:hypothetical protein
VDGERCGPPLHEKLSAAISQRGSTFFGRRALNIAATRAGAAGWFGLDVVKERLTERGPGMGDGDNLQA